MQGRFPGKRGRPAQSIFEVYEHEKKDSGKIGGHAVLLRTKWVATHLNRSSFVQVKRIGNIQVESWAENISHLGLQSL